MHRFREPESARRLRDAIAALPLAERANPRARKDRPAVRLWLQLSANEYGLTVALYDQIQAHYASTVGVLHARRVPPDGMDALSSACASGLTLVTAAAAADHAPPYVVTETDLEPGLWGRGIGAWLYAEGVRLAWVTDRAALVGDVCDGGGTSPQAWRVWRSRSLRSVAHVEGAVALWRRELTAAPLPDGVAIAMRP